MRILLDTRTRNWAQNPYVSCLATSVSPGDSVEGFSWRTALLGNYDVLHVHWPEYLVRSRGRVKSLAFQGLFRLLLTRLALTRTVVVRTVHNEQPSLQLRPAEERLLTRLERHYRRRIFLREKHVTADPRDVHIPHGDYKPWLEQMALPTVDEQPTEHSRPLELFCFGILKPYKNFESVIDAVSGLPAEVEAHVLIAGHPVDAGYAKRLVELGAGSARVDIHLERLPDDLLVDRLRSSRLVVVPYDNLNNSGVIFLCLTLGVPLAVPRGEVGCELLDEFGPDRVFLFDAPLASDRLATILRRLESHPPLPPFTSAERSWQVVGPAHSAAYAAAHARR